MTADLYGASPLAVRADALAASSSPSTVRIAEVPFRAQVTLRVDPRGAAAERIGAALGAALPGPGGVARTERVAVLGLGPDEWLLVGPEGAAQGLQDTLTAALDRAFGAVVDVSAHRTIVQVSGPKAREVLNKGCALDLHPRVFASDRCAQTDVARTSAILMRHDVVEPGFWVFVRASFARYLADWLIDAAAEYGG
ncbi:sarcosine oxidase subunit gamma [Nocardiopsis sp. RSe5-2]|uniref:Sarcosine oxidase subunit gamma n=1 Tax=Nocardiopsis endophytica TaxID=3018445 RepID=A0ABT4U1V0_9ACTN|nr:sarcosine oxidase subunit gamma family protein [Nocardiopsis endophytica]MDA2810941.1 sarcosine oxidase subunit gamma [Nocardiopsis endophytica]